MNVGQDGLPESDKIKRRVLGYYWIRLDLSTTRTIGKYYHAASGDYLWHVIGVDDYMSERPHSGSNRWVERVFDPVPSSDELKMATKAEIALDDIYEAMWPEGDENHEWDGDTMDRIYEAMAKAGNIPESAKTSRKIVQLRNLAEEWKDTVAVGLPEAGRRLLEILDRK